MFIRPSFINRTHLFFIMSWKDWPRWFKCLFVIYIILIAIGAFLVIQEGYMCYTGAWRCTMGYGSVLIVLPVEGIFSLIVLVSFIIYKRINKNSQKVEIN